MNFAKILFITTCALFAKETQAQLIIRGMFVGEPDMHKMYNALFFVLKPDVNYGVQLATTAQGWLYKEQQTLEHPALLAGDECPAVTIGDMRFQTMKDAPSCISVFTKEDIFKQALIAAYRNMFMDRVHIEPAEDQMIVTDGGLHDAYSHNCYVHVRMRFKRTLQDNIRFRIVSEYGKELLDMQLQNPESESFILAFSGMSYGKYFLKVTEGEKELSKQLVFHGRAIFPFCGSQRPQPPPIPPTIGISQPTIVFPRRNPR